MSSAPSFDFQRYVDRQKNPGGGHEARGGFGDYAFSGDLRVLRKMERMAPVRVVVEASVRAWKSFYKNELMGTAIKVTQRQFPHLQAKIQKCSELLDIPVPTVYITSNSTIAKGTYGTRQESFIVLSEMIESWSDEEILFTVGRYCGQIQNSHTVYTTSAKFMTQGLGVYVKWASLPASMALDSWARRGEITADRAGLICCRDEEAAIKRVIKSGLSLIGNSIYDNMDVDELLGQLDDLDKGWGRYMELFQSNPYLPKRLKALKLFIESSYYQHLIGERGGRPLDEIDREVEEIIQVL